VTISEGLTCGPARPLSHLPCWAWLSVRLGPADPEDAFVTAQAALRRTLCEMCV